MKTPASRTRVLTVGFILAGVILLLGGVWLHHHFRHPQKVNASIFENDMMESLVRGMLRENSLRDAPVCFIAFGEGRTPPSPEFIARFADCRRPAVRGVNNSVSPPVNRYFEKVNGRPGLILRIIQFQEFISSVFDVTVSISNLPPGHDRIVYRISNSTGEWVITKRTPN
jgi:hypothetical protein